LIKTHRNSKTTLFPYTTLFRSKIINLMELVVEKGTAKPAKLEGYRVGGKTGTTKKVGPNGYENAYIAGFCGVAPIEDPEVCIYVDRKSTRLNSSHVKISYAVFC